MSRLKVYEYGKCDTCRKALKFLDSRGVKYERTDITLSPPSRSELNAMAEYYGGEVKKLFNTSGLVYKEMKLSEKLPAMEKGDAIGLLASNGKLVKRPFVLGDGFGFAGFNEADWKKRF